MPPLSTGDKGGRIYISPIQRVIRPYFKGVTDPDKAMHSQINVTRIGDYLQKYLNDFGIGAVVDKTDITGKLQERGWQFTPALTKRRGKSLRLR